MSVTMVEIKPSKDQLQELCNCKSCKEKSCNDCMLYEVAEKLFTEKVTLLEAFQRKMNKE